MNSGDRFKKIIIALLVIVVIVIGTASTSIALEGQQSKKIQKKVETNIKVDLEEYLDDYILSVQEMQDSMEVMNNRELSQEEINAIISAVTESIEYEMIKDAVSKYVTMSEESLQELKTKMDTEITKVIKSIDTTKQVTLSSSEKQTLINSVSTIVKNDLLEVLKEYEKGNQQDIQALKESLMKDINALKTASAEYEKTFAVMDTKIENLTQKIENVKNSVNNSSNNSSISSEVKNQLDQITKNYNKLTTEITNINNTIEQLEGMEVNADLTELRQATEKNKKDISDLATLLNQQFSVLNEGLSDLNTSLGGKINDAISGMEAYVQNQNEENKEELKAQLADAKKAIEKEMENAGKDQQEQLQGMLDKITEAEQNISNTGGKVEDLEDISDSLRTDFDEYKDALTKLQGDLTALESTLNQTKETLTSLSGDVASNKNDIESQLLQAKTELEEAMNGMSLTQEQKDEIDILLQVINTSITNLDEQTKEDIEDLIQQITEASGKIAQAENNISTMSGTLTQLGETLDQTNASLGGMNTSITNNTQNITSNTENITNNTQNITTNTNKISELEQNMQQSNQEQTAEIDKINSALQKNGNSGVAKITYDSGTNTLTITELEIGN